VGDPSGTSGNFQSWAHTLSLQAAVLLGALATGAKKKKKEEEERRRMRRRGRGR
jgi:hypothetical protein